MTRNGMTRRALAASMTALAAALPAHAQTSTPNADTRTAGEVTGIEDIVVTAQKRSENLQRTPAAVTAFTGSSLVQSGTTDLRAVQNIVPAARFQQEGATTQVILRGVGSNLDFGNVEPTVAFNVNGIFTPREGTSQPFFDLDRIEVLPGPQGTLYGRNALGGTINVSFKRPTHEAETSGVIEGGNYDLMHATLVQNLPLSDALAVRAAVDYTKRDGYMETGAYSKDDIAVRLGLLYEPSTDVSFYLWGQYTNRDGSPSNLVNKGFDPNTGQFSENAFLRKDPWDELRVGAFADPALLPFGQPIKEKQKYHLWNFGGQLDVQLADGLTLTYIPGYFRLDSHSRYWLGVIPDFKEDNYRLLTQELRLAGDGERLDWLVGLYGYTQRTYGFSYVGKEAGPFGFIASGVLHHRVKGIALFGQATYHLTDAWRITAGGRGSLDKRKANGISPDVGNPLFTFEKSYKRFDFKIGTEYDLTPKVMTYLTYQTAYQPGTFNEVPSTPAKSNRISPPKLSSITGGFKSRFLDNRLQINVEAFYYSYRDLLLQAYDASKPYNEIFNAKAETYGVQIDAVLQPTPDDRLNASVGYLHARTKKYAVAGLERFENLSLPYAADWTINLAYQHDFHLASGYIRPMVDARYESSYFADFVHTPGTRQRPTWRENASITYFADSGRWSAGAWIKNITNKAVIAATAAAGIPGPATAYLEEPRTYGARVTFNL